MKNTNQHDRRQPDQDERIRSMAKMISQILSDQELTDLLSELHRLQLQNK